MRYFLDTEFIEDGKTIDLISIGIVAEDGREYYAINSECNFNNASDWVVDNVLHPIGLDRRGFYISSLQDAPNDAYGISLCDAKVKRQIAHEVAIFLGCEALTQSEKANYRLIPTTEKPQIWGYYADYDWVVFCQLFGTMMDLPQGFPMYCRDIKQLCDDLGNPKLPEQGNGEHNALADAKWNKQAWEFLINLTPIQLLGSAK